MSTKAWIMLAWSLKGTRSFARDPYETGKRGYTIHQTNASRFELYEDDGDGCGDLIDSYLTLGAAKTFAQLHADKRAGLATEETKEQRLARLEAQGIIFKDCPYCREWYEHPTGNPAAPRHQASASCESGKRPHCTCDTCW